MCALINLFRRTFSWDTRRELDRSIRGLERAAEELRLERDRLRIEARS